jgi:CheY-like chemotaxis protein
VAALVGDDEQVVRDLVALMLDGYGYETVAAASAEDAIEHVEHGEVAVVVADINLPGSISGLELIGELHGRRPTAEPPCRVRRSGGRRDLLRLDHADLVARLGRAVGVRPESRLEGACEDAAAFAGRLVGAARDDRQGQAEPAARERRVGRRLGRALRRVLREPRERQTEQGVVDRLALDRNRPLVDFV